MSDVKEYCLGFAFSKDKRNVLLIQKTHPEYMAGKWNGIGGKYKFMEDPVKGMVREFQEETTILTTEEQWEFLTQMDMSDTVSVSIFVTTLEDYFIAASITDEKVAWHDLNALSYLDLCFGVPGMVSAGISTCMRTPDEPTLVAHNTMFIFSNDMQQVLLIKNDKQQSPHGGYVPICTLSYNDLDGKTSLCDYAIKTYKLPNLTSELNLLSSTDMSFGPVGNVYTAVVTDMFDVAEPAEWLSIGTGGITLDLSNKIMQVIGKMRANKSSE